MAMEGAGTMMAIGPRGRERDRKVKKRRRRRKKMRKKKKLGGFKFYKSMLSL